MTTTEELDALEARIENIKHALVELILEQGRREQEIMGVGE